MKYCVFNTLSLSENIFFHLFPSKNLKSLQKFSLELESCNKNASDSRIITSETAHKHKELLPGSNFFGKTPLFFRYGGVNAANAANLEAKRRQCLYTDKERRQRL